MSAIRTQIYLTEEQRRMIDHVVAAEGVSLAEVIRRALDVYLKNHAADPTAALQATFGADPLASHPDRNEWARG